MVLSRPRRSAGTLLIIYALLVALLSSLLPAPASAQEAPAAPTAGFSCAGVTQIPVSECQALVDLYRATNQPGWTNRSGWLRTTTPCSWFGVTCSNRHV